ncbi:MAG: phage holin family protein [Clostridia bacterium]
MRNISPTTVWHTIQAAVTTLGAGLGWFLGGSDGLLNALIVFIIIDYLTGLMRGIVEKKLCSIVGFRGIFRKVMIFTLVGIGHILDTQVIGTGGVLRTAIICFYLSNEGLSVLENAAQLGLPIPENLKAVLAQLHRRADTPPTTDEKPPLPPP